MADAVRHMGNPRACHLNHTPAEIPQTWVDSQNTHKTLPLPNKKPFFFR
jgi:hypothetical protein